MHVLIAEDDSAISDGLARALRQSSHSVTLAADGVAALQAFDAGGIDLLVLDLGLPKLHGSEVLRRARTHNPQLPVLLISALDDAQNQLLRQGLKVDDFLPKPFSLEQFEASIRKFVRLSRKAPPRLIGFGPLSCDLANGIVQLDGKVLDLTAQQRWLLELLVQRNGRPVGQQEMSRRLSEANGRHDPAELETCLDGLRKELESGALRVVAVRGMGYCLVEPTRAAGPL